MSILECAKTADACSLTSRADATSNHKRRSLSLVRAIHGGRRGPSDRECHHTRRERNATHQIPRNLKPRRHLQAGFDRRTFRGRARLAA